MVGVANDLVLEQIPRTILDRLLTGSRYLMLVKELAKQDMGFGGWVVMLPPLPHVLHGDRHQPDAEGLACYVHWINDAHSNDVWVFYGLLDHTVRLGLALEFFSRPSADATLAADHFHILRAGTYGGRNVLGSQRGRGDRSLMATTT
jgi:hypothetical protein